MFCALRLCWKSTALATRLLQSIRWEWIVRVQTLATRLLQSFRWKRLLQLFLACFNYSGETNHPLAEEWLQCFLVVGFIIQVHVRPGMCNMAWTVVVDCSVQAQALSIRSQLGGGRCAIICWPSSPSGLDPARWCTLQCHSYSPRLPRCFSVDTTSHVVSAREFAEQPRGARGTC